MHDVAIIGCGIVGAAAAYELAKYELDVVILEKENDVAAGTTKANSAIIHAGYDPTPGSMMAWLNVEGSRLAKEICAKLDVPHRQCGSFVLAFNEQEVKTIEHLLETGKANGVPGVEILSKDKLLELEPNLSGEVVAALHAPSAMIVSPWEYALALAETAVANGAELKLECGVQGIDRINGVYRLHTTAGLVEARYVLNAAGLYADDIHNMVSPPKFKTLPDRGEYYLLDKSEGTRVSRVIFQCPTKLGKGTLVAPTVHGNLIVGPNNEEPEDCGNVSTTIEGLAYVMNTARKSVPNIDFRASIRNFSGNRAVTGQSDFIIGEAEGAKGFIDIAGIKSPGLSAAPAIAKLAAELLEKSGLALREKQSFCDERKRVRFHDLSPAEKAELVAKNPDYGRVICRCETVTEGEILDSLHAPIPPRSIDAVKRRTGSGMGRCQSGFCGPRVLEILARHYNVSPTEIVQDAAGTYILTEETKGGGECGCGCN